MIQEFEYYKPQTIIELCDLLAGGSCRVLAGGTDILPQLQKNLFKDPALADISQLTDLSFIDQENDSIHIGTLTSQAEIEHSPLLNNKTPFLSAAARSIGCPQTRNRATLGGNIANASPAADTLPPLLALDAKIHLLSTGGKRDLPLSDFLLGPGKTALAPEELIHSVSFSPPPPPAGLSFRKLGRRKGMAIAVVSAAVVLRLGEKGQITDTRIALGSVAPTAVRCPHAETILNGHVPELGLLQKASQAVLKDINPISDLRASAAYRNHSAVNLLRQTLEDAANMANARRNA